MKYMYKRIELGLLEIEKGKQNKTWICVEVHTNIHGVLSFSCAGYALEDQKDFEERQYRYTKADYYKQFDGIDIIAGGQCLDQIAPHVRNWRFSLVYYLWKKYHLRRIPKFWVWVLKLTIFKSDKK